MNCFTHSRSTAVGMCVICQKGVCHQCVARQTPRLACAACAAPGKVPAFWWYGGYGTSTSRQRPRGCPLIPVWRAQIITMRPRIAKFVVAIVQHRRGGLSIGGCVLSSAWWRVICLLLAMAALRWARGLDFLLPWESRHWRCAVVFIYAIGGEPWAAVIDSRIGRGARNSSAMARCCAQLR